MDDAKKYGRKLPNGERWNNKAWRDVRKRAIQTKDPYCAICGKFIDTTLPASTPSLAKLITLYQFREAVRHTSYQTFNSLTRVVIAKKALK